MKKHPKIRKSCVHGFGFYNTFIIIENKSYVIHTEFTDLEEKLKGKYPKECLTYFYEQLLCDLYNKSKTMKQFYFKIIKLPNLFMAGIHRKERGYICH